MGVYDAEFRDNINNWVENQIAQVKLRRKVTGDDPVEKDTLTLFRYLTIMCRCANPYSAKDAYKIDKDLHAYLELCVCKTLARLIDIPESQNDLYLSA
jgi:hypothetical protein